MSDIEQQVKELRQRIDILERLVMSLGDKLLILAVHLGRLSERPELRGK